MTPRWAARLVAAGLAVSLGLGTFVLYGARTVHPVKPADAHARYRDRPSFAGLPGWDKPLGTGVRPPAGVHYYRTTGYAKVNRLGIERRYPAITARLVRHGPGCQWQEEVAIFTEHFETYSACAQGREQVDTGFGTRLSYFFVPGVTDLVCDAGLTRTGVLLRPDQPVRASCRDDDNDVRAEVTTTFLGAGTATVGDDDVPCNRLRVVSALTGSTVGVADRTLCTTRDTGLVLTEERAVSVVTDSAFIGRVTYTEQAEFAIVLTTPFT